ncbi:endonuclease/exonuclease/phosphatase family protein [Nocardia sp. GCM10030253]|uniref:endonuclease/exonuclease/phosphatase family protein n=1 Tax=Nocardia sp. GCM10030253 TaxID=3273404 RepID=UPI00362A6064
MITVATWNVLHRVHAENWGADVIGRWPVEVERIAAITARVAERDEHVIALQEVSGDQLESLRVTLPGRTIHALRYPRVPVPRHGASPLRDSGEYLVLLVDGDGQEVTAEPFENDPGNGALAVRTAGLLVIATHVSGDRRRTRQMARLAELATGVSGSAAVLLGDFNIDRTAVEAGLGDGFVIADLAPDSLPTRPRTSGPKSQFIDHVVVHGAEVGDAGVDDAVELSDHNVVHATISI